jgi:hypothetical protein
VENPAIPRHGAACRDGQNLPIRLHAVLQGHTIISLVADSVTSG